MSQQLQTCLGCAAVSPQTEAMALLEALNQGNVRRPGAKPLTPMEQRQIGSMRMAGLATGTARYAGQVKMPFDCSMSVNCCRR